MKRQIVSGITAVLLACSTAGSVAFADVSSGQATGTQVTTTATTTTNSTATSTSSNGTDTSTVTTTNTGSNTGSSTTTGAKHSKGHKNVNQFKIYKDQIQSLHQQLKQLEGQRKSFNQQIRSLFQGLKGKHVKKTAPASFTSIQNTHNQVVAARQKLAADVAKDKSDRQSKDWASYVTDLQQTAADLQGLITLKQQQVQNLQGANVSAVAAVVKTDSADSQASDTTNA